MARQNSTSTQSELEKLIVPSIKILLWTLLFFMIVLFLKYIIGSSFDSFINFIAKPFHKVDLYFTRGNHSFLLGIFWVIISLIVLNLLYNLISNPVNNNQPVGSIFPNIGSIFGKIELSKLSSRTIFWILFILSAFTLKYWAGHLGDSLGGGIHEGGTSFWSSLTGTVRPETLPISTLSYDLPNGRMIIIPPGEKTFLHVPHNNGTLWYNTGTICVSGLGGNSMIIKKSYHEENLTKKRSAIGAGDYYLYTYNSVKDTAVFKVTW